MPKTSTDNCYNVTTSQNIIVNINQMSPTRPSKMGGFLKQNFHIIGNPKQEDKQIVNILSDNPESGAFFSISMTVYSQQSLMPTIELGNKENKIIPDNILEVDEPETSPKVPESSGKKTNKPQFNFEECELNSLAQDPWFQNLLESYNIKDLNEFKSFDLNSLELKREDLEKIEQFFKEQQAN
jgi:hypothetical protein